MSRGQTLIVFALTLLLLVLMVMVTLGVGARARERMEAQIATDAAAWSEAVVAARTFNVVALINRAQVASLVALAGNQSLISWSGHYRSNLEGARSALDTLRKAYQGDGCVAERKRVEGALAGLQAEADRVAALWNPLDHLAARRTNSMLIASFILRNRANEQFAAMEARLADQGLVREVIALTSSELIAQAGPAGDKAAEEAFRGCGTRFACNAANEEHSFHAVMGTRGWVFTTARAGARDVLQLKLAALVQAHNPGAALTIVNEAGGSGFGVHREGSQTLNGTGGYASWAEDHGGPLEIDWPARAGCAGRRATAPVSDSWVFSTDDSQAGDEHRFDLYDDSVPPEIRHSFWVEPRTIVNMWPGFVDINTSLLMDPADDFGQPKLYAIVHRDYRARGRPQPWNLAFRFGGGRFDNARAAFVSPAGADLGTQVVLAAAMAYYHRPGAWVEPPNLFNPFWRATLVRPDADAASRLQAAGYAQAADTLRKLEANGFKGLQ